tara:strand:+ start:382 stop:1347 length:966 start_codon:yes stop_codon:yes gene_type:complete
MKIVANFNGDADWGVVPYIHKTLEKFNNDESDAVLMNGVEWIYNSEIKKPYKDYKRRCLLALWSPCEFTGKQDYFHFDHYDFFTEVYCLCPYTCKFMNEHFGYEKFIYIPYPFTNYSVGEYGRYDADCSWMGSIHGQDHIDAIDVISKFDYKFLTSQKNTWMRHPYEFNKCTHVDLPSGDKLVELSKCRSSLSFNMIYMSPASVNNKKPLQCFSHFDQGIMPQFKVRTHEITSSKSLMLVKKDPWNLVEDFYLKNEYVSFENFEQLEDIIRNVKNNFDDYKGVIESAFEKSHNYTVEKIFEYISTQDESLRTWDNSKAKGF